jgi:AAA ATPase domain
VDRLLEREADMNALTAAVESARAGRGSVAFVLGEAGIGKTSLLRALRVRVDLPFHLGRCEPLSVPEPLGPLRELAPSLPELAHDDRRRLARALQAALTADGPAVAAIEDAHWADPATLDVLRILARRAEDAPLALLVTLRDDELAASPALAVLVGDLATDSAVVRVCPRPLSVAAVRALTEGTATDAAEIVRVTGGNPFLVAETLAADGSLPASVRDATLARVARLGPPARGLVDLAAVAGQRVAPTLLAALMRDPAAAVDEALARGVLTDDGATLGFRHELTRQAIERSLSTPRRAALHRQVAEALADEPSPDHARIAHHAEQAGLAAMAARHATLAAGEAERLGALLTAGMQLERALRLGADGDRVELLIRYARAMNFAGRDLDDARAAASEAVALADGADDRLAGGRARIVLAATLWSLDRLDEARQAAADAVSLLEATGDRAELARASSALLRIEAATFSPAEAIARAPHALAVAEAAGVDEAHIDMLISLGLARGHQCDPGAAELLEDARRQALERGTAFQVIRAHVNSVAVAGYLRDGAWADRVAADAATLFPEFETTIPQQALAILHGPTLLDRGRPDAALARVAEGRGDWHGELPIADAVEGLVRARRG